MNNETDLNKENEQVDAEASSRIEEAIERIKHPPAIDDVMRELSPDELLSNPAVAPQGLDEASDLRDDLKRD